MKMVSDNHLKALYKNLRNSFDHDEAVDLLIQRYPESQGDIYLLFDTPQEEVVEKNDLLEAVKTKVSGKTEKKISTREERNRYLPEAKVLYEDSDSKRCKDILKLFMDKFNITEGLAYYMYRQCKGI